MSVTLNSVRQLKEQLVLMTRLCDEMLSHRTYDKLFTSADDYEDAKHARLFLPEQYYFYRFFDKSVELRFHAGLKIYYLYYQNFSPSRAFVKQMELIDFKAQGSSYKITSDFEESKKIFNAAVHDFITKISDLPKLLQIY